MLITHRSDVAHIFINPDRHLVRLHRWVSILGASSQNLVYYQLKYLYMEKKKMNTAKQILHNFFNSAANVNSTQEKNKKKYGNVGGPGTFNILVHVSLSP